MGKITKEQQAIIDSLTCERLTKDEANKTLIQDFENNRNKGLADSLREEAWEEDANGSGNAIHIEHFQSTSQNI